MENWISRHALFPLRRIHITPALAQVLQGESLTEALYRHSTGDWGLFPPADAAANDRALETGERLLSSYLAPPDAQRRERRFWVITEADRSATTLLFPSEY